MSNNTIGPGRRYVNASNPNPNQYSPPPQHSGYRPQGSRRPSNHAMDLGQIAPSAVPSAAMGAVKTGLSAGKTIAIIAAAILVVSTTVFIVVKILLPETSPFDPIAKFETAYNDMDYNALIETVDPHVTKAAKGIGSALIGTLGIDGDLIESLMPLAGDFMSEYGKEYWDEEGVTMHLKITEISTEMISDKKANVRCRIELQSSYGDESLEETIKTVKRDGKWYIALF